MANIKPELFWPLVNPRIVTQKFGERLANYYGSLGHPGWDMVGVLKQTIRCAHNGTVTKCGVDDRGRGWIVQVRHSKEPSFETLYGHLFEPPLMKIGDKVFCGQALGYVGLTGLTTGAHLHFELHRDGTPIDPASYWNGMSAEEYLSISNQLKVLAEKVASLIKIWVSRK